MSNQESYNQVLISAQNTAEYQGTILWVVFIVVVVLPIIFLVVYIPVAIANQPKCPDCGSRKLKKVLEKVVQGDKTTLEWVTVCKNCEHVA